MLGGLLEAATTSDGSALNRATGELFAGCGKYETESLRPPLDCRTVLGCCTVAMRSSISCKRDVIFRISGLPPMLPSRSNTMFAFDSERIPRGQQFCCLMVMGSEPNGLMLYSIMLGFRADTTLSRSELAWPEDAV